MAIEYKIEPTKTYASYENAVKAAHKACPDSTIRFFVGKTDGGRYFPVFIGLAAIEAGLHLKFNVVG